MELTSQDVLEVAQKGRKVALDAGTVELLDTRRRQVVDYVLGGGTQLYGFNRGFGHNVKLSVDKEGVGALQENLLRSHACGVGDPAPREVVRAAMLLRAASLARGHSGVRPAVVERLVEMLNQDVVPVVPRFGSVGASGDLAPLSHMALPLMGEGEVTWTGHPDAAKRNRP
ncbi:MAG: aromatic amino acid lyase, partial [bacterium]|nr:aromatic amino acid lyase [bacterium]